MKIRSTILSFLIGGMCAHAQINLQVSGSVSNTGGASIPVQITTGPGTLPLINATLFTNAAGTFNGSYGMSTSSGTVTATIIACDSSTVSSTMQYFDTLGAAFVNFQLNYCNNGGAVDCLGVPNGTALPGTACVDTFGVAGVWNPNCFCVTQGAVDCLGVPNGNAVPGTVCTDSTGATGTWSPNCVCVTASNTFDCLGVLNGSALPGTACVDTFGVAGVWNQNCFCVAQGAVDCLGVPNGSAVPGSACTDSSGVSGTWDLNCVCVANGQVDCLGVPNGSALPGTACTDTSGVTGTWNQNCFCVTQGAVDCLGVPNGNAVPGTACTDSSGVTGTWNPNCVCVPNNPNGIDDQNQILSALLIAPNPISAELNLNLSSTLTGNGSLRVHDLTGKMVLVQSHLLSRGSNLLRIDASGLIEGMYILSIDMNGHSITKRFAKLTQ